MNKRQKIIVSITGIFIVLLALVGLTYAYFLTQIRGNEETKSISISTANLILEYGDGNSIISAPNIIPGQNISPKIFTVTNKGNETVENFNIYLENVINQLERKEDLTYTITCSNTTAGAASTTCNNFQIIENEVNSAGSLVFPSVMSLVAKDTLAPATEDTPAEVHTYTIKATYKNEDNIDQSIDMNKQISAKVNIYDGKTKFLATEIINNVKQGTSTIYKLPSELPTKIAEQESGENEKILSYTFDDLGTSYYYRGNVDDNYVNFSGMCWRIVRIEGDGNVKLILDDKEKTCDDSGYIGNPFIGTGKYGRKIDNSSGSISHYVANYLEPETRDSMSKAFYDFQVNNLKGNTSKLKSGTWCINDKAYKKIGNEYVELAEGEYVAERYYDAYLRLSTNNVNGYRPTLKCNGTELTNFVDVTVGTEKIIGAAPMYVSTLTADEAVYAGVSQAERNNIKYLNNDFVINNNFVSYTLSLGASYNNGGHFWVDEVFGINDKDGHLSSLDVDASILPAAFRPAIIIDNSKATVTTKTDVADLPGTQNNPYVIN